MVRTREQKGGQVPLRTIVQQRLTTDVFEAAQGKWNNWMVLILDNESTRVISSAMGMYDLMENRITIVEDLSKARAPYKDMAPIYLLSPSEDSIQKLIQDWTPSANKKEPLYADSVFVYFLGELPDFLFDKIRVCRPLVKRLRSLGEVNLDFLVKESRAFHFDMKSCFGELFSSGGGYISPLTETIASKLVTICATLNEFPHIRYPASSQICKVTAKLFDEKFMQFIGTNESFWYHGDPDHTSKARATLLLLDRTHDCLSPLMHEFTYQAMVNDLLAVDDDKFLYKSDNAATTASTNSSNKKLSNEEESNEKIVLLNENDDIWVEMRGKHIADVIQTLSTRIKDIVNSSTGSALNTTGKNAKTLTLAQMTAALKELPEYREIMAKLSQHMHISHQCMDILNKQSLLGIADMEQTLATGESDDGRSPKVSELVSSVEESLQNISNPTDRFRLLAIFIISQRGLRQIDQARLFTAARLPSLEERALNSLTKVGIPMVQSTGTSNTKGMGGLMNKGQRLVSRAVADSESEYSSCRYACDMKAILEKANDGSLDIDDYPSVRPLPEQGASTGTATSARTRNTVSARKATKSKWAQKNTKKKDKKITIDSFNGSRMILFTIGGMCYSELRAANEVMAKSGREVVVGSTQFINPKQFIDDLATL